MEHPSGSHRGLKKGRGRGGGGGGDTLSIEVSVTCDLGNKTVRPRKQLRLPLFVLWSSFQLTHNYVSRPLLWYTTN